MLSLKKLFLGDQSQKTLKKLGPTVRAINELEPLYQGLSDAELREKTLELKGRVKGGEELGALLPHAFALVREAAKRTLGIRHFDVQLLGGLVLHHSSIAEMRTGEGKTLVATLPAYLNALTERGVHVITVNDYLARRDAVWMGQIYAFLGLSVGVVNDQASYIYDPLHVAQEEAEGADKERDELGSFKVRYEFLRPATRKEAYAADITYGTNNQFGFDYLRDNIEYNPSELRQRGHVYAIVDEIDSILIDEARTPLIISAPAGDSENLYQVFARVAHELHEGEHYAVDEKFRQASLTEAGIEKAEKLLGVGDLYTERGIKYVHHLETAVRAKAIFKRDKDYVVRDGEVIIVDEFTGRLQPGRRWSEGLHQAIEAKEGVAIQKESRTFASITFQNYFRMYEKLAGMTGTAATSSEEFYKVYGLDVVEIPTNVSPARLDRNDLIFQTEVGKFKAIARKVKELNSKGQPVLIGTVSIEKNELLSAYLKQEGVPHEMLNAKNHEREGEIIAQAGTKGRVTIATNMAGRGVDIKLGGNPATADAREEIRSLGGLFVLGTERHEARRIDNQLRGRSGRQGDPGETQFFVSLEDQLMRVFASDTIKKMMGRFGIPEDQPIENPLITRALESAQTKIEGFNFDARKHVLAYDDILNKQRISVYERRRKILLGSDTQVEELARETLGPDEKLLGVLAEKKRDLGDAVFFEALRRMMLQVNDSLWIEHLEVMEYSRSSVNLRAYGQRDPLIEYQREALRLFKDMQVSFDRSVVELLPNLGAAFLAEEERRLRALQEKARTLGGSSDTEKGGTPVRSGEHKIGRNETVRITNGTETLEIKFKKAEPMLSSGEWKLVL